MKAGPMLRGIVEDLARGIPGLAVKDVDLHHDPQEGRLGTFQVDFDCWAPSMHTREYAVVVSPPRQLRRIDLIARGTDPDQAEREAWTMKHDDPDMPALRLMLADDPALLRAVVGHALDDLLRNQRAISDAAAACGITAPLGRGGDRDGIRIDHLHANVALLDLLCDTMDPAAARTRLREGLMHALLSPTVLSDPWFMTNDGVNTGGTCTVLVTRDGLAHLDVATGLGAAADLAGIRYERDGVALPAGLPATVLTAAAGRRLGSIVQTGRADLDEADIVDWSDDTEDGLICLSLDLPVMRIGDHRRLWSRG